MTTLPQHRMCHTLATLLWAGRNVDSYDRLAYTIESTFHDWDEEAKADLYALLAESLPGVTAFDEFVVKVNDALWRNHARMPYYG